MQYEFLKRCQPVCSRILMITFNKEALKIACSFKNNTSASPTATGTPSLDPAGDFRPQTHLVCCVQYDFQTILGPGRSLRYSRRMDYVLLRLIFYTCSKYVCVNCKGLHIRLSIRLAGWTSLDSAHCARFTA